MADDDAYLCAIEQYLFWRELGLRDREMLTAVGCAPELIYPDLTTEQVVLRLESALRMMRREQRARRAA